jgi:uncharacterized damage-inducible protein DinB
MVDMNKETLLAQYDTCYNKNGWFVAVRNAIDGVTAEQAAWKPAGTDNSIWESLAHEIANNDETFRGGETDDAWQAEVAKFDALMTEWRTLIAAADEAKFGQPVSAENQASWADIIALVNTHNAYHGGQVLLLRKLQGAWNPEKGVS